MPGKSPFSEDWRDCLKAHYTHVIRTNDVRTEKTLRTVLHECGYNDAQINEWYVLATMHVDDVDPDFVPDLELVQAEAAPVMVAVPEMPPVPVALIEEPPSEDAVADEEADDDPPPHDPNGFQQLSMF
ncbi:MAG: hypothetical protein J0M07_17160 [Anaerolineae bacterium]|nr:hypothetical protein [Anaerolineae bacterium]